MWENGICTVYTEEYVINSALVMRRIVGEHAWKEPRSTDGGAPFAKMKMSFPGGQCVEVYSMQVAL